MKKILALFSLLVILLFGGNSVLAKTTKISTAVAPTSVGSYVDFYKDVRLQWKPTVGAVSYNIYVGEGYLPKSFKKVSSGIISLGVTYFYPYITSYFTYTKIGWYSFYVTAVDKNGTETPKPLVYGHVNCWR